VSASLYTAIAISTDRDQHRSRSAPIAISTDPIGTGPINRPSSVTG
jgi:hypothetical protein